MHAESVPGTLCRGSRHHRCRRTRATSCFLSLAKSYFGTDVATSQSTDATEQCRRCLVGFIVGRWRDATTPPPFAPFDLAKPRTRREEELYLLTLFSDASLSASFPSLCLSLSSFFFLGFLLFQFLTKVKFLLYVLSYSLRNLPSQINTHFVSDVFCQVNSFMMRKHRKNLFLKIFIAFVFF